MNQPAHQTTIFIRRLPLQACIGIHEWELKTTQQLLLDLECELTTDAACHSGRIHDTLDYDDLVQVARDMASEGHSNLVETLANKIADRLLVTFTIPWLRLSLSKTAPLPGSEIGVTLVRSAQTG